MNNDRELKEVLKEIEIGRLRNQKNLQLAKNNQTKK